MRRATLALALGLAFGPRMLPQETAKTEAKQEEQGDPLIWWKWANFALLAAGLGYLIAKNVPALFRRQTEEIQKSLADAAKVKKDADEQAAGVAQRLANLQAEIENLRQAARTELATEGERMRREGEHQLQRVQEQAGQEIELMTRGAKAELRKYAGALALDLAQQRIRSRMTPATQENLVDGFLHDLRDRATPRTAS